MQAQPVDASMQLARRPICGTVMDQLVPKTVCGRYVAGVRCPHVYYMRRIAVCREDFFMVKFGFFLFIFLVC
jgi:hypothetical protein